MFGGFLRGTKGFILCCRISQVPIEYFCWLFNPFLSYDSFSNGNALQEISSTEKDRPMLCEKSRVPPTEIM